MLDSENTQNSKISQFVNAGSAPMSSHIFVSDTLNQAKAAAAAPVALMALGGLAAAPEVAGDEEQDVHFRMNATGNIFYSMSCNDTSELTVETKALFESVTVLFAAMTKALSDKGKDLFDYEAWSKVISGSGFFVEVQKLEKHMHIESSSVSIDTQIVQQLLPGLTSGSSMEIAKSVLSAIDGEYKSAKMDETTKLGHLLFICEELFGAPSVTVRLFYVEKETHKKITSSPCHSSTSVKIDQLQEANTFLFVSPDAIAKYAETFRIKPQAMTDLVEELGKLVGDDEPEATKKK